MTPISPPIMNKGTLLNPAARANAHPTEISNSKESIKGFVPPKKSFLIFPNTAFNQKNRILKNKNAIMSKTNNIAVISINFFACSFSFSFSSSCILNNFVFKSMDGLVDAVYRSFPGVG